MRSVERLLLLFLALALAACASVQVREAPRDDVTSTAEYCTLLELARLNLAMIADDAGNTAARERYNRETERVVEYLFAQRKQVARPSVASCGIAVATESIVWPDELHAASRLRIQGIRADHRRDGIGAAFVAVQSDNDSNVESRPWRDPGAVAVTGLLRFDAGVATLEFHDPTRELSVSVGGRDVPLATDFTAPYAIWLSRAHLGRQGDRALFLPSRRLTAPRIYLMQPYDPNRRTVVLLHGLGSSPEAWLNLANDLQGDPELRRDYQVWQVFYPTNLPIPENRRRIRQALIDTLRTFDPDGASLASRDITLVGHSMGGVLSHLLVVRSGSILWRSYFDDLPNPSERERLAALGPYLDLDPLAGVRRAIFIAAPHRGSPVAGSWIGRTSSHFVHLPDYVRELVASLADAIASVAPGRDLEIRRRQMDSIAGLRDSDRYLRLTAELPVSADVRFHSIIGRKDPRIALENADDGTVPYRSAHLAGAESELVVHSGHDAQEHPEAILEVLRILRLAPAAARR